MDTIAVVLLHDLVSRHLVRVLIIGSWNGRHCEVYVFARRKLVTNNKVGDEQGAQRVYLTNPSVGPPDQDPGRSL